MSANVSPVSKNRPFYSFNRPVYSSSSDVALSAGLCPCIPLPYLLYSYILRKKRKLDLDDSNFGLCCFRDQPSPGITTTTYTYFLSEVQDMETILTNIEKATSIRHERSRRKLHKLRKEIMGSCRSCLTEDAAIIDNFSSTIKVYKRKLILASLESNVEKKGFEHNKWTKKVRTPLEALPQKKENGCEELEGKKIQKKSAHTTCVFYRWNSNNDDSIKDQRGEVIRSNRVMSNTMFSDKATVTEQKRPVEVTSCPTFTSIHRNRLKHSSPLVVGSEFQTSHHKRRPFLKKKIDLTEEKTSKARANRSVSVIVVVQCDEKRVQMRRNVRNQSVSAQSISLLSRCDGTFQTSLNIQTDRCLSSDVDFLTTPRDPSVVTLEQNGRSRKSSGDRCNYSETERVKNLWFISAKRLCDEMEENINKASLR